MRFVLFVFVFVPTNLTNLCGIYAHMILVQVSTIMVKGNIYDPVVVYPAGHVRKALLYLTQFNSLAFFFNILFGSVGVVAPFAAMFVNWKSMYYPFANATWSACFYWLFGSQKQVLCLTFENFFLTSSFSWGLAWQFLLGEKLAHLVCVDGFGKEYPVHWISYPNINTGRWILTTNLYYFALCGHTGQSEWHEQVPLSKHVLPSKCQPPPARADLKHYQSQFKPWA